MTNMCGQDEMQRLVDRVAAGVGDPVAEIQSLAAEFPDDPRLQFMLGSVLIETARPIEAHAALSRAVALAPDYAIARFQLGFFELTSGEVDRATATWAPLAELPTGANLRHFVAGLGHLVRDSFPETIAELRAGIAANHENPPMNRDMQLIIDRCTAILDDRLPADVAPGEASATSLLLGELAGQRTMH